MQVIASAPGLRRQYAELLDSITQRLKSGFEPQSMSSDSARLREIGRKHSALTGRHPAKPPEGGWPAEATP